MPNVGSSRCQIEWVCAKLDGVGSRRAVETVALMINATRSFGVSRALGAGRHPAGDRNDDFWAARARGNGGMLWQVGAASARSRRGALGASKQSPRGALRGGQSAGPRFLRMP